MVEQVQCSECHNPIRVMAFLSDGVCSVNCREDREARLAAVKAAAEQEKAKAARRAPKKAATPSYAKKSTGKRKS